MLFTCRSWKCAEPRQKKPAPFYIPQRQKTNYQYDFLVNGSQEAWGNLWKLTEAIAGRMLAHNCKLRNVHFSHEEWEDKRAEAVMYLLRRYRTRPGYLIETNFPLHIWYAVKHVLDYKRKCDGIVEYVSGAELDAIIESQNEDL